MLSVTCIGLKRKRAPEGAGLEFGRPVLIGRNVWIGAGAIILPGVSIGDDALIGLTAEDFVANAGEDGYRVSVSTPIKQAYSQDVPNG